MTNLDLRNVRAIVTDADVLGRIDPGAVAAYLQCAGWFQAHERRGAAVWSRWIGDHAAKLLVPNDPTFGDYAIRMSEVLAALALTEDRSQLAVLADLHAAPSSTGGIATLVAAVREMHAVVGEALEEDRRAEVNGNRVAPSEAWPITEYLMTFVAALDEEAGRG